MNVSPDGRHIVFVSDRTGTVQVWTAELGGGNERQVTESEVPSIDPHFTADGTIVFRSVVIEDGRLEGFRAGPTPAERTPLFPATMERPLDFEFHALSPDGRLALGHYIDREARGRRTAVVPIDGASPSRTLPWTSENVRWARDSQAIKDIVVLDGVNNIVRLPLDGSPARPITQFTSGLIFRYAWSRDGKLLAMARGTESADVVLITSEDAPSSRQ